MSLAKALTPSETEEVKPGLFVQKYRKGWRKVEPIAWGGKFRWKAQLRTVFSFRTLIFFIILLLVVWSYLHDVGEYKTFYETFVSNPIIYCENILATQDFEFNCTDILDESGICMKELPTINFTLNNFTT